MLRDRIHKGLVAGVLAGMAITFLVSPSAQATNFSGITGLTGCNDLNQADNANHGFNYVDLTSYMAAATDYARTNAIGPTDVYTSIDPTPDEHTDVDVIDRYYVDYCGFSWYTPSTGGVIGAAKCDLLSSTNRCDHHSVRYSNTWTDGASTTQRRWLACHENGHALGLMHRSATDSCMPPSPPSSPSVVYSAHDIAHLNDAY